MKCVCGYENLYGYELEKRLEEEPKFINGDENFIKLDITATYEKEGNWHKYTEKADICACPKCGVLKIDIFY